MPRFLWIVSVVLSAVVLGASTAIWATQTLRPTGMVKVGPWEALRAVGDTAADPYVHAFIASSGQLPLGSAEGVRFIAWQTNSGRALVANCSIQVSGTVDVGRLWTLSITRADGTAVVLSGTGQAGLHSQDVVYNADGSFDLSIGPTPDALNAVLLRSPAQLSLILSVYDGSISNLAEDSETALPQLSIDRTRPGCNA
ncbi:MAG: DUF1214 domain-containing protein [Pseudomonadota bacterium]